MKVTSEAYVYGIPLLFCTGLIFVNGLCIKCVYTEE